MPITFAYVSMIGYIKQYDARTLVICNAVIARNL